MAKKANKKANKTTAKAAPAALTGDATDLRNVERLVQLMVDNGLTEVEIANGEKSVALRRGGVAAPAVAAAAPVPVAYAAPAAVAAPATAPAPAENFHEIKSPMVGTFYAAPSPDSDPYVATGAQLTEETVVCIVEAMKVMNEIKAECRGQVVEVCVKNAQPVEYGQVLFKVRPNVIRTR